MKITVERRTHDYIAFVNDDRTKYESAKDEAEAIGRLVMHRAEELGIEVERPK